MLEIYVSTDVETDGPVAGKHSILSIGSAAYTAEKELLSTLPAASTTTQRSWDRGTRSATLSSWPRMSSVRFSRG